MQLHSFSDTGLLNGDLAEQICAILAKAIKQRGQAYLVVSGGKTPIELFKILAQSKIDWEKVIITLADERCVASDNKDRNERLVKNFLLQHEAQKARFLSLYDEKIDIAENIQKLKGELTTLPTFDAVILGMGEDGHTASLFPCSDELSYGLDDNADDVLFINPQKAPYQRVSLSKRRLLDSHHVFLHLVGQKKRTVFNQALSERDPMLMPVSAFLNNDKANVQVMYAP